ncbi:unnamed protein product [Rotaria sp. Silwood1]|nr:unnamed protein product [Rotaria sp. Silwood1]CAF0898520.1 unnamed protein product [Rotaria sp. Silwood1]CAF3348786.1 unnamed protein product [Rotaria sp. Silwood1]CAF3376630.1 unnamed protein product [Rotaria sp. Silwood1]CAF4697964.1 unnamed protein product [Rotaria sp. Silwood1]
MSAQESKKKPSSSSASSSSPPKRSKKEHKNEKDANDVPIEEVHTVNDWENADLGDDQRKQKFLRLMGAKKHKDETRVDRQDSHSSNHNDDVSSEKKHSRSKVENETIERELEKQFNEGLQSKITHTHHEGLGFHGDNSSSASSSSDWHHQSTKTKFVPAKTEVGSSMEHVQVDDNKKEEDKSNDKQNKSSEKQEKKKKSKS